MFETIPTSLRTYYSQPRNSMNGDCHTISLSNLWHEHLFVYWYRDQRLHNPNRHLLSNVHPTLLSVLPSFFFRSQDLVIFGSSWSNRNRIFAHQAGDDLPQFLWSKWRQWMANPSGWNLEPSPFNAWIKHNKLGPKAAPKKGPNQKQCTNHKENGGGSLGMEGPGPLFNPPSKGP